MSLPCPRAMEGRSFEMAGRRVQRRTEAREYTRAQNRQNSAKVHQERQQHDAYLGFYISYVSYKLC
jgi:hypothetical protein